METFAERVNRAYLAAFARPPLESEINEARQFFEDQGRALNMPADQSQANPKLWADFCHVLFNVKEFVFLR